MRLSTVSLVALLASAATTSVFAQSTGNETLVQENPSDAYNPVVASQYGEILQGMENIYKNFYAPIFWKNSRYGVDINRIFYVAEYQLKQRPYMTKREFHVELMNIGMGLKDYHVSVSLDRTELSTLGFGTWGVIENNKRRVFISYVSRNILPESVFPFDEGDEIVRFNGRDIATVVYNLRKEIGDGNVLNTDWLLAARRVGSRLAALGQEVPQGLATLEIRKASDGKIYKVTLPWQYRPETVLVDKNPVSKKDAEPTGGLVEVVENAASAGSLRAVRLPLYNNVAVASELQAERLALADANADAAAPQKPNKYIIGGKISFVPELGKIVWRTKDNDYFDAYIFEMPNGEKAGYIRLNTYSPASFSAFLNLYADRFGTLLNYLEANTTRLVIDQVNNPGGAVFYLYALASMLAKEPLKVPYHQELLHDVNPEEWEADAETLEKVKTDAEAIRLFGTNNVAGYPVTVKFAHDFAKYARALAAEKRAGKTLSRPLPLYGIAEIPPHAKYRYTKPVLLLINELDFSGGDFFPAIMQDNKRATLLGARTAGAGGYIRSYAVSNEVGLSGFSATGSLAWRPTGNPIENLGVTPDIPYNISGEDLRNGYQNYKQVILRALANLR